MKGKEGYAILLDASELPDKVEEVKFFWYSAPGGLTEREYYAIGKVMIGSNLE